MTAADVHHSRIEPLHVVTFGLGGLDEGVGHGEAVAVFPGAAGDYYNVFAHAALLLVGAFRPGARIGPGPD